MHVMFFKLWLFVSFIFLFGVIELFTFSLNEPKFYSISSHKKIRLVKLSYVFFYLSLRLNLL